AETAEPGSVAHMADHRLDQQPGERRRDPQAGQFLDILPERLEDAAHIGVLQRKADLDAEKAEADVPQAGKALPRLLHCLSLFLAADAARARADSAVRRGTGQAGRGGYTNAFASPSPSGEGLSVKLPCSAA